MLGNIRALPLRFLVRGGAQLLLFLDASLQRPHLVLHSNRLFLQFFRCALLAGGLFFEVQFLSLGRGAGPQPGHKKTSGESNGGDQSGDCVHKRTFDAGKIGILRFTMA